MVAGQNGFSNGMVSFSIFSMSLLRQKRAASLYEVWKCLEAIDTASSGLGGQRLDVDL